MAADWDLIVEGLRHEMERIHRAREDALGRSRMLIQTSSKCIRHVHRHQFEEAVDLLAKARQLAYDARAAFAATPEILYAGYLQDAEKEMVEAAAVVAMAQSQPLPDRESLGVQTASYLNGMGEAASEMRRFVLDEMRHGRLTSAARILGEMESIYDDLITFDYPDGATGGLRRTCDALRAVIERTRSDLTMTTVQQTLLDALRGQALPD